MPVLHDRVVGDHPDLLVHHTPPAPAPAPQRACGIAAVLAAVTEYRGAILTAWYLLVLALIVYRFWDYWITLV